MLANTLTTCCLQTQQVTSQHTQLYCPEKMYLELLQVWIVTNCGHNQPHDDEYQQEHVELRAILLPCSVVDIQRFLCFTNEHFGSRLHDLSPFSLAILSSIKKRDRPRGKRVGLWLCEKYWSQICCLVNVWLGFCMSFRRAILRRWRQGMCIVVHLCGRRSSDSPAIIGCHSVMIDVVWLVENR